MVTRYIGFVFAVDPEDNGARLENLYHGGNVKNSTDAKKFASRNYFKKEAATVPKNKRICSLKRCPSGLRQELRMSRASSLPLPVSHIVSHVGGGTDFNAGQPVSYPSWEMSRTAPWAALVVRAA